MFSLSFFKHFIYTLLSSLLLIIAIYFPIECLIPQGLHVLRMPIALTVANANHYHFSITKKTSYCLFLEKDRTFPLQKNEYQEKPFQALENITINWEIGDNQQILQRGTTQNHPFKGSINAKEVNRLLGCFELGKGNYGIHIHIIIPLHSHSDHQIYRIKIDENVEQYAKQIAWISYYCRMLLITIFTLTTSTLSLFFIFRIAEKIFSKLIRKKSI